MKMRKKKHLTRKVKYDYFFKPSTVISLSTKQIEFLTSGDFKFKLYGGMYVK
jgi:hypothetical protein